jgi:geranylgeranyl transferase type-1 subunit beta
MLHFTNNPQDIYHSYLALAILAIWKEPGLKSFDPALCVSAEQREKINAQRSVALVPTRTYWKHGYSFSIKEDDPNFEKVMAESEDAPDLAGDTFTFSQAVKI